MRCIEDVCVFYKKAPVYKPQGLIALENTKVRQKKYTDSERIYKQNTLLKPFKQKYTNYPVHFLEFDNEAVNNKNRFHPTQKPVKLLEYLIKTYTNTGDVVLDNCMGSGSTGVACVNAKRNFIGIELDEEYYNIATERIEKALVEKGACSDGKYENYIQRSSQLDSIREQSPEERPGG